MKSRQAIINIISSLFIQIITIFTGLVVNRIFTLIYGTNVNGMVGGVSQIISALSLIEAGVGAASVLALYKPLSEKNNKNINGILSETQTFYYKSGWVYIMAIMFIVLFYPYIISDQMDVYNIRLMIIILSLGNIIDYFFFGKYRILLTADQKLYIINFYQSISMVISTVVCVYMMYEGYSYVVVKLVASLLLIIRFFAVKMYVIKNYGKLKLNEKGRYIQLDQRKGAFIHQIATVVVFNTDIVVITIFGGNNSLMLAGVYYMYNVIATALLNLVNSVTVSMIPSFGHVFVEDNDSKKDMFQSFEFLTFIFVYFVYTCFAVLLGPFIKVYTNGITDINYNDDMLVLLFVIIAVLQSIRMPGNTMIAAAGHYKETQWRSVIEAVLNIISSIILINYIGVYGVLLGTIISFLYRSIDTIYYNDKYIIKNTMQKTVYRIFYNTLVMFVIVSLIRTINYSVTNYFDLFLFGIISSIIAFVGFSFTCFVLEKAEFKKLYSLVSKVRSR